MREIIPYRNNPVLRQIAQPIPIDEIESPRIRSLIADMSALLANEKHGVAIAAQQVGEPLQLFVVSGKALAADRQRSKRSETEDLPDQVYINAELIKLSKAKKEKHEGCLSVKGYWGEVPRAEKATIRAFDENGKRFERGASGFLAHVYQHEMDHLRGILYLDKAARMYEDDDGEK